MQSMELARKSALEELIILLSEFYKSPTEEFFQEIISGDIDEHLKGLFKQTENRFPDVRVNGRFSSFDQLKQTYLRCFLGMAEEFAPPIESVYKVWTEDSSARVPHAKSKGYLYGDAALHMRYLYENYKLEIPNEYANMPDHLTLLLEFWAYLINHESEQQVKQYLIDHFDWLDDFIKELRRLEDCTFYVDLTIIVRDLTSQEIERLKS